MSAPSTEHLRAQHLLRHEVAAARLVRDVVTASGPDAVSYLQGQLSQDLEGLEAGRPVHALVLEPGGRVDAWMRVWPVADDQLLLEVDRGAGEALLERLNRFKLRVAVELELSTREMVAVRGPATPAVGELRDAAELAAEVDWAGLRGVDLIGVGGGLPAGVEEVDAAALEVVRIEAGRPAMGSELGPAMEPRVIPAEAGDWLIDASVSFTKGCYTGQELVARVDSRGSNTPRKLRGVVLTGEQVPPVGAEVLVEDRVGGTLTSVGYSAELGAPVALGYLHRSVAPGATATVRWDDGDPVARPAVVRELPLVGG